MKFYHSPNHDNKGGITLCYELIEHSKGKAIAISFAQCSKKDQYCKKTGRALAAKRMMEGDMFALTVKGSAKAIRTRLNYCLEALTSSLNQLQSN